MISGIFLNLITGIACGMTASSLISAYMHVKKHKKGNGEKIEKYKLELEKQLLELEKMEKDTELEGIEIENKKKYEDTKIIINNLIKQYNDMT